MSKKQREWTKKVNTVQKQLKDAREKEKIEPKVKQIYKDVKPKIPTFKYNHKSQQKLQTRTMAIEDKDGKSTPTPVKVDIAAVVKVE